MKFDDLVQDLRRASLQAHTAQINLNMSIGVIKRHGHKNYRSPKEHLPGALDLAEEQLKDAMQRVKALRSKLRAKGIK